MDRVGLWLTIYLPVLGKLKSGGSRYAWPAAEKKQEETRKAMIQRLQIAYDTINARLAGK